MTIGQSRSRKGQPNERPSCSLVVAPERGMSFEGLVRAAGITADCCSEIVPR